MDAPEIRRLQRPCRCETAFRLAREVGLRIAGEWLRVPQWDTSRGLAMSADIDLQLGKRLRRRRRLLGLTQSDVAERVGIRFQQIQKYECGGNRISAARLWQFIQVLDVPPTYFYDGLPPSGTVGVAAASRSHSVAGRPMASEGASAGQIAAGVGS